MILAEQRRLPVGGDRFERRPVEPSELALDSLARRQAGEGLAAGDPDDQRLVLKCILDEQGIGSRGEEPFASVQRH